MTHGDVRYEEKGQRLTVEYTWEARVFSLGGFIKLNSESN